MGGNQDGSNPNTKTTMVLLTCTPVKSLPTPTTKVSELVKTLNSTLDQLNSINSATPVKILPFNSLLNTTKKSIVVVGTLNCSQLILNQKIYTVKVDTMLCSDQIFVDTLLKKFTLFLTTMVKIT